VTRQPVPVPVLESVSTAPSAAQYCGSGSTAYYLDGAILVRLRGSDPSAHYAPVIERIMAILPWTKTPWRDANLIWMAVRRRPYNPPPKGAPPKGAGARQAAPNGVG